jgi:hypothetical protein
MFILELNVTNKTHTSDFELLESGAAIRSFRDRGKTYILTAHKAMRRADEQAR